jgi:hypothetical protein
MPVQAWSKKREKIRRRTIMAYINLVHKHFDEKHLAEVIEEMKKIGSPIIKAVKLEDEEYQALEGCHRIRAAKILGLPIKVELIEENDERIISEITDVDRSSTVKEFCDWAFNNTKEVEIEIIEK